MLLRTAAYYYHGIGSMAIFSRGEGYYYDTMHLLTKKHLFKSKLYKKINKIKKLIKISMEG